MHGLAKEKGRLPEEGINQCCKHGILFPLTSFCTCCLVLWCISGTTRNDARAAGACKCGPARQTQSSRLSHGQV
eukprot:6202135-Pleurochrysis_carterae.AAC.3